jgi:hypothetical protein
MCVRQMRPPVGGLLDSENYSCPLSQKPVQKWFLPRNGVAFLTEDVFAKKFSGAGEDSGAGGEGSYEHRFDLAVCAGHLTGWQGVLTPPSIARSPSAACSQGAPPRIQNNSGLSQGPATPAVVG